MKKFLFLLLAAGFAASGQSTFIGSPIPLFNTVRNGTGAPSNLLGNEGDFYIDTTTGAAKFYGPKYAGVWGSGTPLTGGTTTVSTTCGLATATSSGCVIVPTNSGISVDSTGHLSVSLANLGPLSGTQTPAYTGAVTKPAGSTVTTLAPVFSFPGSFGDASHTLGITVNSAGQVTTVTSYAIAGGSGGSSGGSGFASYSYDVVSGAINGTNTAFTLAAAPNPANSLILTANGVVLKAGVDYSLSGASLTMSSAPDSSAVLQAWYETGGSSGSSGGLADPGANGVVVRTAANVTSAVAAPAGTLVGTTDTQTLTNKTVDGVSPTTLSYLDATSSVQTQINSNATAIANNTTAIGTKQAALTFTGSGSKTVTATAAGTPGDCVSWQAGGNIGDTGAACGTGSGGGSYTFPGLTGDITSSSGSYVTTLATVNSSPGTFGDATHSVTLTVDGKGRLTAVSQNAISGGGGGAGVPAGTLASLPATCTTGNLYFATDQPAGQELYGCSATNTWTQFNSLGASGALAYTGGALDIVSAVVPKLAGANTFTGLQIMAKGVEFTTLASGQPACSSAIDGQLWFLGNGATAAESWQSCLYNGTGFAWTNFSSGGGSYTLPGTVVQTNQANTYTAGMKQTFGASATTAGAAFSGVSADPSSPANGDLWYRTDLSHLSTYNGSAQRLMYQSDSVTAGQMPALTGDVTSSAGSPATTLATVNSSPGTTGSASNTSTLTTNAKGLVTANSSTPIAITHSAVTDFNTAVAAAAPITGVQLNGTTITPASGVVNVQAVTSVVLSGSTYTPSAGVLTLPSTIPLTNQSNTFGAYSQFFGGNVYAGASDCFEFGTTGTAGLCDAGSGALNLNTGGTHRIQISAAGGITVYSAPVPYPVGSISLGASGYQWANVFSNLMTLVPQATLQTCSASVRGQVQLLGGTPDHLYVCTQTSTSGAYANVTVF